ncbi:MAG: glycosyl hydrolase, partial [Bacteroidales bacterium]|nr:glycosyl hydrolase [Bacteroidales bacterium]
MARFPVLALIVSLVLMFPDQPLKAQFVTVGSGSYTTTFPGVDAANRNTYPSGTPQVSEIAAGKPVPTNDWWSLLIKNDHAGNLFNYPMALKTTNPGLVVSYIPWGVYDDQEPVIVGVSGLNASKATVADYSDWTVTMAWNDGTRQFQATSGIAMPFLYFEKGGSDVAQVKVQLGTVTVNDEMIIVENARNGADFVIYAPAGSSWNQAGNTYTSTLNGKNYWSMAMLPQSATNIAVIAGEYKKYAYVFPTNTTTSWTYDEANAVMHTDFLVETETKEGTATHILQGLLPHQWANLAPGAPQPGGHSYSSVRGEIKMLDGNSFSVENRFRGILPTLPYLANYSEGFSPAELNSKIGQLENDGLATWTDSYNEGQVMNRLIQAARIADLTGDTEARDKIVATIKTRLEDWLTAEASEVAFLFYYNSTWTTLIGYPAGHGQDGNINDHHFHWGYFIHAAAFMEQFEPGWAAQWGEMVNLLVRDAAASDRNDDKFPFLRNFSPYAGHCWANGFATFPQGNDQESTSESMQFNSALIHWGSVTGNDTIRDLGIYLYTTEQTAIEEYWFDIYERNFSASQQYSLVSRVWGNSYDNGTFWTSDIAASYGIEMYPIHGGSLYLGHPTAYVQKLWTEITANTGILSNEANPNLWHDVMWKYLAFIDPQAAIDLYDSYPDRSLKFGISDAQTYYWLHAMNALGTVRADLTADYPVAAAFLKDGTTTYVAHNYSGQPITVTFSDGTTLEVPARQMATSRDLGVSGLLTSDFQQAYPGGSVRLSLATEGETPTRVAFYDGTTLVGTVDAPPYSIEAGDLAPGIHGMYARIYIGEDFNISNQVSIQVGEQLPWAGLPAALPGTIEAGLYDKFEGGTGQGISYVDLSTANEGGFRPGEYVDAVADPGEGATVGWIAAGEWLEYMVDVETAGVYDLSFRYASGNANGGGPFHFEIDGRRISPDISVNTTNYWDSWSVQTAEGIELGKGVQVLRIVFTSGEFNLGRMTFTYAGALDNAPPYADAGAPVVVLVPDNTATLDGSSSYDPEGTGLSFQWEQVYGPTVIDFSDPAIASPAISNLVEGIYKCRLTVNDGTYSTTSSVLVIVSSSANLTPFVLITAPANNASFYEGSSVTITASANDLNGEIVLVEFFDGTNKLGEDVAAPYSIVWDTASPGIHEITARATDDGGASAISARVKVEIVPAPSCSGGPENGDYTYLFSDEKNNPTLTFIPGGGNAGDPTCILYYGTSQPFPGYNVTPGVPFRLNAEEGTRIQFYYTYSFNGTEKNTIDAKHSYVIGTCLAGPEDAILSVSAGSFSIDENSEAGTFVGQPEVIYTGANQLAFSIASGNDSGAFQVDGDNGDIAVANPDALDFETTESFVLDIIVTDGTLSDHAAITILLNDVIETGFQASFVPESITVYPNPFRDHLHIAWTDLERATVSDLAGRRMFSSENHELHLGHLKPGIYILQLSGKNSQEYQVKIIR